MKGFEPFGSPCTILKKNSKFGEVADEGLFVGYVVGSPNNVF